MNQASNKYMQQLRKLRQLSQEEVAQKLKISRPTYVQIENNRRPISLLEAEILAGIFEISFDDFRKKKLPSKNQITIVKDSQPQEAEKNTMRISVPQKHMEKFKEVLLYILGKVGSRSNVGQTVLYKLLYFIDFDFYEKYEEQLIGATYIKNHYGPTPIEFRELVADMKKAGELVEVKSKYFKYDQTKYLPSRKANLSLLTAIEKDHIDEVLQRLANKTAVELSNYSHKDVPWIGAEGGEKMDYEAVFYRTDYTSVRSYEEE